MLGLGVSRWIVMMVRNATMMTRGDKKLISFHGWEGIVEALHFPQAGFELTGHPGLPWES
jgi:hypothetical protein